MKKNHSLIFVGVGRFAGEDKDEMYIKRRESCANEGDKCRLRVLLFFALEAREFGLPTASKGLQG